MREFIFDMRYFIIGNSCVAIMKVVLGINKYDPPATAYELKVAGFLIGGNTHMTSTLGGVRHK